MKLHWKKYTILIGVAISVFGILVVSAVQFNPYLSEYPGMIGAINFYRTNTANIGPVSLPMQSVGRGWRNFGNEAFDVFTPEYCKKITVSTGAARDIFIPTRSIAEWDAFKNSNALTTFGVSISSCTPLPLEGCDILSGTVCGDTCPPGSLCVNNIITYNNECEMVMDEAQFVSLGACLTDGACDPNSGPVSGGIPCDESKQTCLAVLPECQTFANECAMEASGATFSCDGGAGQT